MRGVRVHRLLLAGAVSLTLALTAACDSGGPTSVPAASPTPVGGGSVIFATEGWETQEIANNIAMFIVEKGYGKAVENMTMASTSQMQLGFEEGHFAADLEMHEANYADWLAAQRRRKVVDRGNLYQTGVQGFYVPASVTGVKTIEDVKANPAKVGKLISCPKEFSCAQINKIKLKAYGIPDSLQVVEPASWAEYFKAVNDALTSGQPFLAYYREPSTLVAGAKLVRVTEPEYDALCWARIRSVQQGTKEVSELTEACAYPADPVLKAVSRFLTDAGLQQFIFNMNIGDEKMNELIKHMADNKTSAKDTALFFLKNNEAMWSQWVPADVAAKAKAALG